MGGVGKTRLALEAASRAIGESPDGVFLVDLSALTERRIGGSTGRRPSSTSGSSRAPRSAEQLVARLHDADMLIVLDNCEHLREACAELCGRLLGSCPRLRVLATSREALGVPGEVDYPVPPLPVPSSEADLEELRASEAVRLFLARASDVQPRRSAVPEAFATAARICRDLDGLPLAIELAAARAKAFSFEEIASRLDDRFQFLVSWRRLSPARHRTLRAAMDWSYELLSDEERTLLDRLSVFAGGFTLAAAAAVCLAGLDGGADDLVGRLVDASLIVPEERDGETRYRLLETVRQYAAERLESRGETADVRRRHADHFLTLAESAQTRGAGQLRGLGQLDADIDNLRDRAGPRRRVPATRRPSCGSSRRCGRTGTSVATLRKARDRLESAIAREGATAHGAYTRAVYGAGILAWSIGDYGRVRVLAKELLDAPQRPATHDRTSTLGTSSSATSRSGSASSRPRSATRSGRSRLPGSSTATTTSAPRS